MPAEPSKSMPSSSESESSGALQVINRNVRLLDVALLESPLNPLGRVEPVADLALYGAFGLDPLLEALDMDHLYGACTAARCSNSLHLLLAYPLQANAALVSRRLRERPLLKRHHLGRPVGLYGKC